MPQRNKEGSPPRKSALSARSAIAQHLAPLEEETCEARSKPDVAPAALLELLQSPACLLDGAGSATHLNAAWRQQAGLGGDGNGRVPWAQLVFPEDRYSALSQFRSAAATGRRTDFQCRLQDEHGTARWFLLSLQPVAEDSAIGHNCLCFGTDIDELKRREADLEKRASIQTDMLNISVDCIKLIALDGTLVHMNKAGCDALGVPQDSSFGMPWLPLLPEDVWPAGAPALATAKAGSFARFPAGARCQARKYNIGTIC